MRWKLLFVAPLLAGAVAAGAVVLWARLMFTSHAGSPLDYVFIYCTPLAAASGASVFVYRHTARRRVLQAIASLLLSLVLFYVIFNAAHDYFNR